ncbi:hypothetical protein K461DRAFT_319445 [Myriangium duriaei CBS 260.36]|uniref:BZIP domain-containing protein n=1 Tax=Myriangium duriaei CBS 260.36 TaxID=1168546 RepID=A0A9P4MHN2_9PEZI|nr:hypothetical protein K461DRAFT_319445 [Myriangium duriaei CBS 260.36]
MSEQGGSTLAIPSLQEDSAERRRVLNVLAQRRYRRRKREKIQTLQAQVQKQQQTNEPTPSSTTTVVQQANQLLAFDFLDPQIPFTSGNGGDTTGIHFNLPGFPLIPDITGPSLEQFDESSLWPDDSLASTTTPSHSTTSTNSSNSSNSSANPNATSYLPINTPTPANDFADYLITTPGLSVIRAHTEIFDQLVGPGFDLDIFNPAAISPISLGYDVQPGPLLLHFTPTPLQRHVKHHPIIDVLPWPSFRDRFLYVMSLRTEQRPRIARKDMAGVTLELMLAVKDAGGGIRVWDQNGFAPDSWEIGQTFYSKFWWAIDDEIVRNSNKHRELRGENRLNRRSLEGL